MLYRVSNTEIFICSSLQHSTLHPVFRPVPVLEGGGTVESGAEVVGVSYCVVGVFPYRRRTGNGSTFFITVLWYRIKGRSLVRSNTLNWCSYNYSGPFSNLLFQLQTVVGPRRTDLTSQYHLEFPVDQMGDETHVWRGSVASEGQYPTKF